MLKLISLNVERSKHLDRNIPFFQREEPDILCLQEVFEADFDRISQETGLMHCLWQKDTQHDEPRNGGTERGYSGSAIFSRHPFIATGSEYYYRPERGIRLEFSDGLDRRETNAQSVIWARIDQGGETFFIANTHFTWTPNGETSEDQLADFNSLKEILLSLPPHILVGDLNAPRGNGMWEKFQALYAADNIPAEIRSTIDPELHMKKLEYVVDALFSSAEYTVQDVQVVSGVSDHQAIIAKIGRV
ncbi:MAG: endonuclease/exonuclease/phosphatase family protein [Undibacterium sp.]